MYYYDPDKDHSKRWAALAALLYGVTAAVVLLLVTFDLGGHTPQQGGGVLIDFGTTEEGFGEQDLPATDVAALPEQASQTTPQPVEHVTDDRSEVAVSEPSRTQQPRNNRPQQPTVQPRQANPRALFPGRTAGSNATSEGPASGQGNAGSPEGAAGGSHSGTGQGDSGIAYDLSGRSVVGALPKPSYPGNESGRVVVEVTVDASGRVTYAAYRAQGSTTSRKPLIDAAVEAAYKARFSPSESLAQSGTIIYTFRLN